MPDSTTRENDFKKEIDIQAKLFLDRLFKLLSIDVGKNFLDHICFRVDSKANYLKYKALFMKLGRILISSEIGGREITTFKLDEPIKYKERIIEIIELPSPKLGHNYKTGFEHAEFVIKETLKSFITMNSSSVFNLDSMDKGHNPEVRIRLEEGISVKFHRISLENIIKAEIKKKTC